MLPGAIPAKYKHRPASTSLRPGLPELGNAWVPGDLICCAAVLETAVYALSSECNKGSLYPRKHFGGVPSVEQTRTRLPDDRQAWAAHSRNGGRVPATGRQIYRGRGSYRSGATVRACVKTLPLLEDTLSAQFTRQTICDNKRSLIPPRENRGAGLLCILAQWIRLTWSFLKKMVSL